MDEASSSYTKTQRQQAELESAVGSLYEAFASASNVERTLLLTLHHDEHEEYVGKGLRRLSAGYYVLDSSRPWLCYWIVHSLALLRRPIDEDLYDRIVSFLEHCQDPNGGYAGGPGQMPHLATTYAATCTLVTLGGEKALASINRKKILQFLLRMKDPCGGFRVHDDGEMDMRGSYTALAVAHLLDILVPEVTEMVGEHVHSCQTYEGGIGGEPGAEAHGGYTFCGLAAVALIDQLHVLNLPRLVNWVVFRQGKVEGGFQGRTNKLVDGCYSFWQAGCFQLLQQQMPHLRIQQTTSAAALLRSQDEGKATKGSPPDAKVSEEHTSTEPDYQDRSETSEAKRPKPRVDCLSSAVGLVDVTEEAQGQASQAAPAAQSSQIYSLQKISTASTSKVEEASEEFSLPTKDFYSKRWTSDEDEVESWDSDRTGQNSAEKLFPMVEADLRKVPSQAKQIEIVELADAGVSGSSSNSTGSALDVGSVDSTLCGPIFNCQALQAYILICCQDLEGGLRDKPGKPCDYYHTCYCLSGLAVAQYSTAHRIGAPPPPSGVAGPYSNLVEATHAICNVRLDRYHEARSYFKRTKETVDS